MRSTCLAYQVILLFLFSSLICCKPLEALLKNAKSIDDTVGEEGLPNLRKVLYPTYAREPYGTDFYTNIDMGNPSYGTWGPMYRYNDLFDRPMRSQLRNEQIPSIYIQPQISSSYSAFAPDHRMPFVPFYSGIGKGR